MEELYRYGFYLSLALIIYGTLLPFKFDFSAQALERAWGNVGWIPYWDIERGRIHSLPDIVSNILLTVPLGFFGFMRSGRGILRWGILGLLLGTLSEALQLGVVSRVSDVTDLLNNGLGAFIGAGFATLAGRQISELVSGSLLETKVRYFWIMTGIIAAGMLLPFDIGLDVSQIKHGLKALWLNPWESGVPVQDEWIQMAEFVILGALAASMRTWKWIALAAALPFVFEPAQLLIESHAPSLRDLSMNFGGVTIGVASGFFVPWLVRPGSGFALMSAAIAAQGLSPYHFVEWSRRAQFQWIPLLEYYNQTSGAALYDAVAGLLSYGLLAALWPSKKAIVWSVALASGIEVVQLILPGRAAGITDILIAAIGAWAGYTFLQASPQELTAPIKRPLSRKHTFP